MRILAISVALATQLLTAPAARADVKVVVVGAKLGGSPVGGDPAPDGDGVFFGSGVPVINDAGQVAFYASFTTGSGGTGAVRGGTEAGSLRLIVREDDPAPDGNGYFGIVGDADAPAFNNAGQVVMPARFVRTFGPDDTSGIVRGDVAPDTLTLLARQGQTVDGLQLGSLFGTPLPSLNASGEVVFGTGIISAILRHSGGANTVVARSFGSAPDSGTYGIVTTPAPVINDLGQIAFAPLVSGSGASNIEFLRIEGSTAVRVVRHGDPVPGGDGTFDLLKTANLIRSPALNEAGDVAFQASVAGTTGPGTQGIFRALGPDHVVTIVRRGDPTPDGNGTFLSFDFKALDTVPLNDAGQAAFLATLTGTSGGNTDNLGIFRGDGGALTRVVRKGEPAPDGDGYFADLTQPTINANGQVAFQATLSGTTRTQGIFLYNTQAGLNQVVRQGDSLLREPIARLGFAHDTSRGRKHLGLNAHEQVAFQFGLQDGRVGVAVWSAGATTTTVTVPTTTTVLASTTTTALPSPTTTTLPACTTLGCVIDAARQGPNCGDEKLPTSIAKKLDLAATRAALAPSQPQNKARRLYRSVRRLLTNTERAAIRAAAGRHPKLSTACASDLVTTLREGAVFVGGLARAASRHHASR